MKLFSRTVQKLKAIAANSLHDVVSTASSSLRSFSSKKTSVKAPVAPPPVPASSGGSVSSISRTAVSASTGAKMAGSRIAAEPFRVFEKAKRSLIAKVEVHPISVELSAGATGTSSYLTGGGDLFSFMGFEAGSDPVGDLIKFLEEEVTFRGYLGVGRGISKLISFKFGVSTPDRSDFARNPKLCLFWEKTNPWPFAIEEGIAGYANYVSFSKDVKSSVSKRGLQLPNSFRSGEFTPTNYMTELLEGFFNDLRGSGIRFEKK